MARLDSEGAGLGALGRVRVSRQVVPGQHTRQLVRTQRLEVPGGREMADLAVGSVRVRCRRPPG